MTAPLTPKTPPQEDFKKWFEANFLDGDESGDGYSTMLQAKDVFVEFEQYVNQQVNQAKDEILDDLIKWEKMWFDTHLSTEPFNWYGAVKALKVSKDFKLPFVSLQSSNQEGEK